MTENVSTNTRAELVQKYCFGYTQNIGYTQRANKIIIDE